MVRSGGQATTPLARPDGEDYVPPPPSSYIMTVFLSTHKPCDVQAATYRHLGTLYIQRIYLYRPSAIDSIGSVP
jgi:hypothetical protein